MNLPLSKRLQACCDFVCAGDRVADVGCDHGYLGIHLLRSGIAHSVIAADINEMPLQSAVRNAEKFGVRDKMQFFLSDGVQGIPHDFDALVCAGMGGDTIISILDAAPWLKNTQYRLILQCQSKTPMLRKYLAEQKFHIKLETVLRDGRFLYTVMVAQWDPDCPKPTLGQLYFPPALLINPSAQLPEYYQSVVLRLRRAVTGQGEHADPVLTQALQELENDPQLTWLKEEHHDNG